MIPYGPKWIKAGSVRVRYFDEGEGDGVLLLHGLGGFADHWQKNIGSLSNHFRVIAPDIVGFGFTDKPRVEYTLEYFSDFVKSFIDVLALDRLAVVGTSLGGAITILLSLLDPSRVSKLVLVASVGLVSRQQVISGRTARPFRKLLLPIAEAITLKPNRWILAFAYRRAVYRYGEDYAGLVDQQYEISRLPDAQRVFYQVSRRLMDPIGSRSGFRLADRLGDLQVPALLISGQQDRVVPPSDSALAQRLLPNATLVELEKCGHMPYFEKPTEFNTLVIDFLKS